MIEAPPYWVFAVAGILLGLFVLFPAVDNTIELRIERAITERGCK